MFSLEGASVRCCDGLTRRDFLRIGGLGAAGLMLPDLLSSPETQRAFNLDAEPDKIAAYPVENPVSPGDLGATIYTLLGIRTETEIVDQTGRPHPLVRGEVIRAIL